MQAPKKHRSVFFDVRHSSEDEKIGPLDPDPTGASRPPGAVGYFSGRAGRMVMVSNPDTDGLSLTIITLAPGTLLPTHRHDVDYIEFILEGEVHHGNRVLKSGEGGLSQRRHAVLVLDRTRRGFHRRFPRSHVLQDGLCGSPGEVATAQVAFGKLLRDPGATPDSARVPGAADHTVLPRKSNLFRSDVTRIDRDGRQREEPVQGVPAEI